MIAKRKGIYLADLGNKAGSSVEGGIRPVIVLQNDIGNKHSPTVIVAPITSKMTKNCRRMCSLKIQHWKETPLFYWSRFKQLIGNN